MDQAKDRAIIAGIQNKTEAMMDSFVASSVGQALLQLMDRYFGNLLTEASKKAALDEAYLKAKKEIKDFFGTENQHLYSFLKNLANESSNVLDRVTLTKRVANELIAKTHIFPLKEVITLVWQALQDDQQYLHFTDNNAEKILKHREERKQNFLTIVQQMYNDQRCHQGNRNEFAFILTKTFPNIDIIEDFQGAVLQIIRKVLFDYVLDADQKDIKKHVISWLQESPMDLIEFGKLKPRIIDTLETFMLSHAYWKKIDDQFLNDFLPYIEFACDATELPNLYYLHLILSQDSARTPLAKATILMIQNKIQAETFDLLHPTIDFKSLYFAYKAYQDWYKHKELLKIVGEYEKNDIAALENYFEAFIQQTTLPPIEEIAQNILKKIDRFRKDKLMVEIGNFFCNWFYSRKNNKRRFAIMYNQLLDHNFQEKVLLQDEDIQQYLCNALQENYLLYLTVYDINRVFLHAIIKPVSQWSRVFSTFFELVVDFVKNTINQPENTLITTALFNDSYKPLIKQLDYLVGQEKRMPAGMILLPQAIQIGKKWIDIAKYLKEEPEIFLEIYKIYAVHIKNLLLKDVQNNKISLLDALISIPEYDRIHLIKILIATQFKIKIPIFYKLLLILPIHNRMDLIIVLGKDTLQAIINKEVINLIRILGKLSNIHKIDLITMLDKTYLQSIINNQYYLLHIFENFPGSNRIELLHSLGQDVLKNIICGVFELVTLIQQIPKIKRMDVLDMLGKAHLINIIPDGLALHFLLRELPKMSQLILFDLLGQELLQKIIKNGQQLCSILNLQPEIVRIDLLIFLGSKALQKILQDGSQLSNILRLLPVNMRMNLLNFLGNEALQHIIQDGFGLSDILKTPGIHQETLLMVFNHEDLQNILYDECQFNLVFDALEPSYKPVGSYNRDLFFKELFDCSVSRRSRITLR